MRRLPSVLALAASTAFAAQAALAQPAAPAAPAEAAPPAAPQTFESPIQNGKGEPIGKIMIRDGASSLVMRVTIQPGGLPPAGTASTSMPWAIARTPRSSRSRRLT